MLLELNEILAIYAIDFVVVVFYFFSNKQGRLLNFFLLLGSAVIFASNAPLLYDYLNTGNTEFFHTIPSKYVEKAFLVNLIYLLLWQIGFWIGTRFSLIYKNKQYSKQDFWTLFLGLCVSSVFYLYFLSQNHTYGIGLEIYSGENVASNLSVGFTGGFKGLFVPMIAALLIVSYRKGPGFKIFGLKPQFIKILLWLLLIATIGVAAIQELQRGAIVQSVILIVIVLLSAGIYFRRIFIVIPVFGVVLFTISPIIDLLRNPWKFNKQVSVENVEEILTDPRHLKYLMVEDASELFSLDYTMKQIARKSYVTITTAALIKNAEEKGFKYFQTYPSIFFEFVPRAIIPDKPIPLSTDGTKASTAMVLAGIESGYKSGVSFWESGAGSLYWQFSYPGLILGSFIIGILWSIYLKHAFYSNSIFLLLIVLINLRWGLPLILGLDNFFFEIFSGIKLLSFLIAISILLSYLNKVIVNRIG